EAAARQDGDYERGGEHPVQDSCRRRQLRSSCLSGRTGRCSGRQLHASHAPSREGYEVRRDLSRRPTRDFIVGTEVQLQLAIGLLAEETCDNSKRLEADCYGSLRQFDEEQIQPRSEEGRLLGRSNLRRDDDRLARRTGRQSGERAETGCRAGKRKIESRRPSPFICPVSWIRTRRRTISFFGTQKDSHQKRRRGYLVLEFSLEECW